MVAVAGEALFDLVPVDGRLYDAVPGGSPANVAIGLSRLGMPVSFLARLSGDAFGRRMRAHLEDNGVDLSSSVDASEPTTLAVVSVGSDGAAAYDFRIDGTADWQWQDEELLDALSPETAAVHVGSVALMIPPGADVLFRFLEHSRGKVVISFDPNVRPALLAEPDEARTRVRRVIQLADVVKASSDDVEWLTASRDLERVVEAWLELGPSLVAVTIGAEGVMAATPASGIVRREGLPVEVIDTIGAGDSFTSALLSGLWRRQLLGVEHLPNLRELGARALAQLLDEAVCASAFTCTRRGADLPRHDEIASWTDTVRLTSPTH